MTFMLHGSTTATHVCHGQGLAVTTSNLDPSCPPAPLLPLPQQLQEHWSHSANYSSCGVIKRDIKEER